MKPKDKAKELVEKMFNVDLDCENKAMCMLYPHAVRCALVTVDEILNWVIVGTYDYESLNEYWLEVKQELEKL